MVHWAQRPNIILCTIWIRNDFDFWNDNVLSLNQFHKNRLFSIHIQMRPFNAIRYDSIEFYPGSGMISTVCHCTMHLCFGLFKSFFVWYHIFLGRIFLFRKNRLKWQRSHKNHRIHPSWILKNIFKLLNITVAVCNLCKELVISTQVIYWTEEIKCVWRHKSH